MLEGILSPKVINGSYPVLVFEGSEVGGMLLVNDWLTEVETQSRQSISLVWNHLTIAIQFYSRGVFQVPLD